MSQRDAQHVTARRTACHSVTGIDRPGLLGNVQLAEMRYEAIRVRSRVHPLPGLSHICLPARLGRHVAPRAVQVLRTVSVTILSTKGVVMRVDTVIPWAETEAGARSGRGQQGPHQPPESG
jgi:hypothetical protein